VGYVLTALCEGGLERFTLELARRLPRDRFQPFVFCLTPLAPWADRFREADVPIITYQARNRPGMASAWPNLRALLALSTDLRRHRIQIVHTCDFYPAAMGRLAALLARVPGRVHTLHSLYDWYPGWAHHVNRLLATRTHQVTAVSNPVLESSLRLDKLPSEKCRLVHNGVDAEEFQPREESRGELRDMLGLPASARIVATVGAYTERKGHRTVAQAILPLMEQDPDLHLVLFGTVPEPRLDIRSGLRELFVAAGRGDRLHMPGPLEDVRIAYCGCDIFCMASLVEGLSLACIEAQMCSCLCLFSDIPSFREVVQEGVNGFLFPVGDADALRRAISQALILPNDRRDAVRKQARRLAVERFPIESTIATYAGIYEEVIGEIGQA
jgi:glycosyltransferase involved in cell wall biosynthesis